MDANRQVFCCGIHGCLEHPGAATAFDDDNWRHLSDVRLYAGRASSSYAETFVCPWPQTTPAGL